VQLIIKKRRMNCGYSGKDFAEALGISAAYLSQLEKGVRARPSELLLQKAASLLSCSVSELFDGGLTDELAGGVFSKSAAHSGHAPPVDAHDLHVREPPPSHGTTPAAPPQPACRLPASCDLPHELADMKAQLAMLSTQVDTLTRLLGATLAANIAHNDATEKRKAG